ncbi:MAG TPA: hypothetical protein PKC28_09785 [Bdellovibrionales bacterium]|nr:hypothetical protein [Bdellovibrionales bacterium]
MLAWLIASLVAPVFAAEPCTIARMMNSTDPDQRCQNEFLKNLKDPQDVSEAKTVLRHGWKGKIASLERPGFIELSQNGRTVFTGAVLQHNKPMILWLNGKIFANPSDNPSIARRLDPLLRRKSAWFTSLIPEARADDTTLEKEATLLFALGNVRPLSGKELIAADSGNELAQFLPRTNWLMKESTFPGKLRCVPGGLIDKYDFEFGTRGADNFQAQVVPVSPTDFKVYGLAKKGEVFLISLPETNVQGLQSAKVVYGDFLSQDRKKVTVGKCDDPDCISTQPAGPLSEWNFLRRLDPAREKEKAKTRWKPATAQQGPVNREIEKDLVQKLFALSILGDCCESAACAGQVKAKYGIELEGGGIAAEAVE